MAARNTRRNLQRTLLAAAVLQALAASAGAATYNWSTGSFSSASLPNPLLAPDVLSIVAGGTKSLDVGLANQSTISASDDLYVYAGNTLTNQGGYDLQGDVSLKNAYGGYFVNTGTGTLLKSAGTDTSYVDLTFTNNGGGIIHAASGAINFRQGDATFADGTQFAGAGQVVVSNSASFNGGFTTANNLNLTGGTFTGGGTNGAITQGNVNWTGGMLQGTWTVASGQTLSLLSGNFKYVNASLSNLGTLAASDDLHVYGGNTLSNQGVYDLQGDVSLKNAYGGYFVNAGTLTKSSGIGTSYVDLTFTNNGGGIIHAASGAINLRQGDATFADGTQFAGAGQVVVSNSASFNGGFTTANNLNLTGGTFTGGGTNGAIINGNVSWTGGTLQGTWTIASGQTLSVQGGNYKYVNASLSNLGTLAASDDLYVYGGNTLSNQGVYDLQGDVSLKNAYGGYFVNAGTLVKSSGAATSSVDLTFTNNGGGIVDVKTGTLNFSHGDATFGDGTQFAGAGQVVVSNSASFNGGFTTANNLSLTGGTFTGGGTNGAVINGNVNWTGGTLQGTWTITSGQTLSVLGGNYKFVNASLSNLGTLAASDDLYVYGGNILSNQGVYDLQGDVSLKNAYGGYFVNTGTLVKSSGAATSYVDLTFTNNGGGIVDVKTGTLNFSHGDATFNAGTQFAGAGQVVVSNSASFNGGFTTANNLNLTAGTFTGGGTDGAIVNGNVNWAGGMLQGTWTVAAGQTLSVQGGNYKYVNGSLTNKGTVSATDNLYVYGGNTLANQGTYELQGDVGVANAYGGNFVNTGLVAKTAGTGTSDLSAVNFVNATGGVVDVRTGTIQLPQNFSNQGTLKGVGSFATNLLTNAGHVAPGESPGTLNIAGSFAQTADGSFDVELGDAAGADLLLVSGTAALGGTLSLICWGDCTYTVGQQIVILQSTGLLSGQFAGSPLLSGFAAGAFSVDYFDHSVVLTVTQDTVAAVPEPGTWMTLLAGLVVCGGLVRRRRA